MKQDFDWVEQFIVTAAQHLSCQAKTHPSPWSFWQVRNLESLFDGSVTRAQATWKGCQQTSRPWAWVMRLLWQDNNTGKKLEEALHQDFQVNWGGIRCLFFCDIECLHSSWRSEDDSEYPSVPPSLFWLPWQWNRADKDCKWTIGDQQFF